MDNKLKIGKVRASLVLEQPFFASIMCNLPMIEDANLDPPTMATNGKYIKFHPQFVEDHSFDELKFVVCHEVLHCVYQHMFRRGHRNHYKYNVAADYVINDLLIKEHIGKMPAMGLHNPQLVIAGGGTSEGVYDLLPDMDDKSGGLPGHGSPLDNCEDSPGSAADVSAAENEMKVMVAQAAQAAKMCGKLSANMSRFVDDALKPKVDWREVLRRFVANKAKIDHSFARPKRRFIDQDIYLPSLTGEMLGCVVVAVDCSGSIGQQELSEFAAEIGAIKDDMHPSELHVVYFDSEVCHHDQFGPDDQLHIEPHGGGGTAFSPIFRFIDDQAIEPACCVVLTDLYCHDFGPPTPYPSLWVTTAATAAPWGEVVEMKPKGL